MELTEVQSLVQSLKDIDQSNSYVAFSGGRFYRVASKGDKNLDTAKIAEFGKEAFETLKNAPLSYSEKAKLCEDFSVSLKQCVDRVYKHKTVWQKIASWFGFVSQGEKELSDVAGQSKKTARELRSQDRFAKEIVKDGCATFQQKLQADQQSQLKLLYMGIFDSSPLKIDSLDGTDALYASLWLLEHLMAYREEIGDTHPHAPIVDEAILEFQRHNDLLYAEKQSAASLPTALTLFFGSLNMEDWTIHEILGSLHNLKKTGDEVTIGGGYRSYINAVEVGHSVQYVFKLENEGSYSLTFVNTGEGMVYHPPIQSQLKEMWNFMWGKENVVRAHVKDDVWSGIPKEALTEELVRLLTKRDIHPIPSRMADIVQDVSNYFSRFPSVQLNKGRDHKLQKKGSCAVKSLTSWLHERLGDQIWRDFKTFFTKREMQKIDRLAEQIPDPAKREIFKKEGYRLMEKREGKKVSQRAPVNEKAAEKIPTLITRWFSNWI